MRDCASKVASIDRNVIILCSLIIKITFKYKDLIDKNDSMTGEGEKCQSHEDWKIFCRK